MYVVLQCSLIHRPTADVSVLLVYVTQYYVNCIFSHQDQKRLQHCLIFLKEKTTVISKHSVKYSMLQITKLFLNSISRSTGYAVMNFMIDMCNFNLLLIILKTF